MVSVGDRDRLELPLTLAKFSEALLRMPTNKSLGMDRLTVEFYCAFWDILGPDLVTVWAESLQSGVLPLSCSTDYKIVAKAISLQLGSMMADVIHPDQTYTVPGRSIFDNLFLVRDLLELGQRDGLSFALLSLDQEKAFDRVDHGYLLRYHGYLLCRRLDSDLSLRMTGLVLREPELRLVLLVYADDVLLVVQDPGDLARVEACQAIYSAASSARVNWVKSSGLAVGDWRQETHTDLTAKDSWQLEWGDRVYFSHSTIQQAGVATLFSPDLRPEVLGLAEAVPGRLLHLRARIEGLVVNLINIYAPTSGPEWLQFYQQLSAFLGTLDSHECLVLGGDFNTTLEERDCSGTDATIE
ncbi:unnamed protein product [Caretta caretta]